MPNPTKEQREVVVGTTAHEGTHGDPLQGVEVRFLLCLKHISKMTKERMFFTQLESGLWHWHKDLTTITVEMTTAQMWVVSTLLRLVPWYKVRLADRAKVERIKKSFVK